MRKSVACIVLVALAMAMAVPGSISPAAAKSGNVLRIATLSPRDTEMTRGFTRIDRGLRAATQDEWSVQLFPSGIQGDEKDVIRKMKDGVLDGSIISDTGLAQIVRDVTVLQAPGVIRSYEDLERVQKVMNQEWEASFDKAGYKLIAWGEAGQYRTFSKTPVTKPDDLKSMRPWLWPENYVQKEFFHVIGATGVPLDLREVYPALQTDIVNFVQATALALVALQWHIKLKYVSNETDGVLIGALIMTKKKWESIPEQVRSALYKQIKENYEGDSGNTRVEDKKALDKLLQRGFTLSHFSPEGAKAFEAVSKQVRDHLVGRAYSRELLDRVMKIARGETTK